MLAWLGSYSVDGSFEKIAELSGVFASAAHCGSPSFVTTVKNARMCQCRNKLIPHAPIQLDLVQESFCLAVPLLSPSGLLYRLLPFPFRRLCD